MEIKNKIENWILNILYKNKLLVFKTWKSSTHLEQYTSIEFMGKELERIVWSELDKINKPK